MHTHLRGAARSVFAASVVAGLWGAGRADGEVVRWVQAQGGAWDDGAFWDAHHPPASTDDAAFGPAATYTVTLAATTTVTDLVVDHGSPTIDGVGNRLNIGALTTGTGDLTIGGATGIATLTFRSGSLRMPHFGSVYLGTAAGTAGTLTLESDATMPVESCVVGGAGVGLFVVRGTAADVGLPETDGVGRVYLHPGSTIRVEGGSLVTNQFQHLGGQLEVLGGSLNFLTWGASGAGTTLITDGASVRCGAPMRNSGTLTISAGATVSAAVAEYDGDVRVDGAGTSIVAGAVDGGPMSFIVSHGASVNYGNFFFLSGTPEVSIGPGCTFGPGDFRIDGGHVRLEQGAAVSVNTFTLPAAAGLIEAVNGAALPVTPMINCTGSNASALAGTLEVQLAHPNNVHIGDQIEVVRFAVPYQGAFSLVTVPTIGGGRQLVPVYTSSSVFMRVVAGGQACWTADFDGDGDVATDADIEAFFACLAGHCCATCAPADFDGDGEIVDRDIEAFFRVLAGGAC
jgi:hypothetical protein